ncbi:PLD nuclease N-terminal domain-containing protein [Halobacillus campisalis]|uniref:PLD nuclease N-terminal domain-containing protein n=1 Tax=Halobacillus campisalis TaxID=435909 RepID=A0ABW2K9M6_9BACI|nr:PLD nuclease N-terminal domain-containing protein [Halobacillus campisalis]
MILLTQSAPQFFSDNLAILAPLIIIQLILVITALISLAKAQFTNGPKWLWALIIIFFNILGPIAYFIFGKDD